MIKLKDKISTRSKDASLVVGDIVAKALLTEGIKQAGAPIFKVINGVVYTLVDNVVPGGVPQEYISK